MMGCSSPHPHGQIWASDFVPTQVAAEDARQAEWLGSRGAKLLAEVVDREEREEVRIVDRNDHWLAIVPWWAAWPFEILLIARDDVGTLPRAAGGSTGGARFHIAADHGSLRSPVRHQLPLFDGLAPGAGYFQPSGKPGGCTRTSIRPCCGRRVSASSWSVTKCWRKPQRDLTPEQAAERLRAVEPYPQESI
jgi:UDPglucose--hexose-1-phosphate uridylyltransferase